jgi:hypothetical protein
MCLISQNMFFATVKDQQDGIYKSIQGVTDFKQVRRVCIK